MNKGLKDKILSLHDLGKSYNEISKELGCSKGTISFHCNTDGKGTEYNRPNNEQIDLIKFKFITERKTVKQISEELKFSVYVVRLITKTLKRELIGTSKKVVNWRKRTKLKLVHHFGGKCQICGYNKYEGALEFHHKDPSEKDFSLSGKSLSFDKMLEEAKKCVLVCGNCHSEIHAGITKI